MAKDEKKLSGRRVQKDGGTVSENQGKETGTTRYLEPSTHQAGNDHNRSSLNRRTVPTYLLCSTTPSDLCHP